MPRTQDTGVESRPGAGPEFDLTRAWADSKYAPSRVYQIWHALYKAYGSARQQFPDVDWISLIAILDVIAMARANHRRVDISYLAAEMRWPRTTTLRRLQSYAEMGYLTLTREGRHTYVDNTLKSRRAALKMIDVVIDSIDHPARPGSGRHVV
jgi:excinuclease UvrABC ATPase subunit